MTVLQVQPGIGTLQAAYDGADAGDELVLADGTYTGSDNQGDNVLKIGKSITVRALSTGKAILDGEALAMRAGRASQ